VRVVFDAAAKNRNGKSLNSQIWKGPNMLQDLFSIMLRFQMYDHRSKRNVFTSQA
jgi:hypothetical protein